jgi:hypothetical protein
VQIFQNRLRLGSTRNFDQAISLAQGEFIALCDQDDRWKPQRLARLAQQLVESPLLGGVFSDADLIDDAGRPIGSRLFEKHRFTPARQRAFMQTPAATLLKHDIVTGATLMFRSSIRSCSLPTPASWVHDGWLAWMIAVHSRFSVLAEPLVDYRIHAGQQLGVGAPPVAKGAPRQVETRRQHYARVAQQFDDLLERLASDGGARNDNLIPRIRKKIAFLKRQSTLSQSLGVRVVQILGFLPSYVHYARGVGSLCADFLLGRETI